MWFPDDTLYDWNGIGQVWILENCVPTSECSKPSCVSARDLRLMFLLLLMRLSTTMAVSNCRFSFCNQALWQLRLVNAPVL